MLCQFVNFNNLQYLSLMHQSNKHFNTPRPSRAKPGHLTIFLSVNGKASWGGEFDLCLGGVGKIEPEVSGLRLLSFLGAEAANSYKHVFGRDGEFKWRKRTFVSNWFTEKGCLVFFKACVKSREYLNINVFKL